MVCREIPMVTTCCYWCFCCGGKWNTAQTTFLQHTISDHSPAVTSLHKRPNKARPFKFLNLWAVREEFLPLIATTWQQEVEGHPFLQLTNKLRLVKEQLKKFHHLHSSHISRRVSKAREEWGTAQTALDTNPSDAGLKEQERRLAYQYNQLLNDEESYYRQKSRIQWLKQGDRNTKFFHRSLLHRRGRNTVPKLIDEEGMTITDPQQMGKHAANYYDQLLNSPHSNYQNSQMHFHAATSTSSDLTICKAVTDEEIRESLFSISDDKAQGPDGFTTLFFKKS